MDEEITDTPAIIDALAQLNTNITRDDIERILRTDFNRYAEVYQDGLTPADVQSNTNVEASIEDCGAEPVENCEDSRLSNIGRWDLGTYTYTNVSYNTYEYNGEYNDSLGAAAQRQPVTPAELADAQEKQDELNKQIDTYMSSIRNRVPRRRLIVIRGIVGEIRDNAEVAFRELRDGASTHDQFVRYLNYLSEQTATADDVSVNIMRNKSKKTNRKTNLPDTRSWMFCPIGIEYTFHAVNRKKQKNMSVDLETEVTPIAETRSSRRRLTPSLFDRSDNRAQRIVSKIDKAIKDVRHATGICDISRAYLDQDMVEVCSPVHRNWKSMRDWYRWMTDKLGKSVTATSRKRGSGGGHINCSIPRKNGMRFMYNLLVDIGNRPYINWVFNDPSDNHTANCMWDSRDMQRLFMYVENSISDKADPWSVPESEDNEFNRKLRSMITSMDSRGNAIRIKSEDHYEFRCFDAIRNERDLLDTVAFVSAYCRYIYNLTVDGKRLDSVGGSTDSLYVFARVTRRDFNRLVRKIGLDPKDYRRFIDRNFETRRRVYGKKHLV